MWFDETLCQCGCGAAIYHDYGVGRRRLYFTPACRQRAYRDRLRSCVVCGAPGVLPLRPRARVLCPHCGSVLGYVDRSWRVLGGVNE